MKEDVLRTVRHFAFVLCEEQCPGTRVAPLMEQAVFALAGVVVGIVLRGAIEHRRWVRETRLAAYSDFLEALDMAADAATDYMQYVSLMPKYADDEEVMPRVKKRMTTHWKAYKTAEDVLRRRGANVELVGSWLLSTTTRITSAGIDVEAAHLFDYGPAEVAGAVRRWEERRVSRQTDREDFIRRARADLRTDVSLTPWHLRLVGRVRRLRRRVREWRERRRSK